MTNLGPVLVSLGDGGLLAGFLIGAFLILRRMKKKRKSQSSPLGMSDEPVGTKIPFGKERRFGIIPGYVKVEMTRIREVDVTKEKRRVVTARFLVSRRVKIFITKLGIPNMPRGAYILDPSALNSEGKIVYNEQDSEPYQADGSPPRWSPALDLIMANSFVGAAIEVATIISGFQFGRAQVYVLAIAGILGFFIVWTIAPLLGFFPSISVHWLPAPPVVK